MRHFTVSTILTLAVAILFQFDLDSLRGWLQDQLYRIQWWENPHPELVIVGYDEKSSIRYSGSSKVPAQELVRLLRNLKEANAKAIGVFLPISSRNYTSDELISIGNTLSTLNNVLVGYTDDESLGRAPPQELLNTAKYLPGMVSRDTFSYGADGVTRRVMIAIEGFPTAYAELARFVLGRSPSQSFRNEQYYSSALTRQTYIHWQGRPPLYPVVSSRDVVEKDIDLRTLKDKVIIVGNSFPTLRASDYVLTPFSRDKWSTPYLEGVSQSVTTLLNDNGVLKTNTLWNFIFSLAVGLFTVNLVLILSPLRGIAIAFAFTFATFFIAALALFSSNISLDLAHPLLTVGLSYYLVIPYRLFSEYRSRWHYQEKSELMFQLEQLKSNFLSLVSHDLKTPVARIQGAAELISRSTNLSEKERKSLLGIIQTTEDLTDYIESLLDLTRIENAKMPLNKVSKDINAMLRDVANAKLALAQEKNIELVTELEPIFSFKFDPKLMYRVVANLVENAIKYSPPGTQIKLISHEDGDWVRVSVVDQGTGIADEEKTKVFEKFYRGSSASINQAKGSGLGLYLVKYFVELHKGWIDFKSELGKGSTFTVALPVS